MSKVTQDAIDHEVAVLTEAAVAISGLKTQAERFRTLAYLVDKYMSHELAIPLWRACETAERKACADHSLMACKTCWPETP